MDELHTIAFVGGLAPCYHGKSRFRLNDGRMESRGDKSRNVSWGLAIRKTPWKANFSIFSSELNLHSSCSDYQGPYWDSR